MSEDLLDEFFKDKLQNFSSPIPQGAWEIVVEKNTIDNFFKGKLENFESVVPENTFDKILAKNTFDHFVKEKLSDLESSVPENTFEKIAEKRTLDNFIKDALIEHESSVPSTVWERIIAERETDMVFKNRLTDYASDIPAGLWQRIVSNTFRTVPNSWFSRNAAILLAACFMGLMITTYAVLQSNKKRNESKDAANVLMIPSQKTDKTVGDQNLVIPNNHNSTNEQDRPNNYGSHDANNIPPVPHDLNHLANRSDHPNNNTLFLQLNASDPAHENTIPSNTTKTSISGNTETGNTENEFTKAIFPAELYSLNYYKNLQQFGKYNSFNGVRPDLVPCPNAKQIDWFVEPYISPDYSSKVITNTGGLNPTFLQLKDSAESMRVGFTAGIRLTKRINNHMLMKGGIQYSQINEQLALRTENERKTTTVIVSRTIVRPQGDTTINDTTTVTQIGYRITKSINHYKNIEIPLTVGYEFGDPKSQWKFAVNGGVALNIATWYSGYTLDTSLTVTPINPKGTSTYSKSSVGVSILASASIIRNIDERTDAFLEPYLKYGLSGTNSAAGFSQKFNTVGIQAGIRVKLNYVKHHY